jgi:hypothetical protein
LEDLAVRKKDGGVRKKREEGEKFFAKLRERKRIEE